MTGSSYSLCLDSPPLSPLLLAHFHSLSLNGDDTCYVETSAFFSHGIPGGTRKHFSILLSPLITSIIFTGLGVWGQGLDLSFLSPESCSVWQIIKLINVVVWAFTLRTCPKENRPLMMLKIGILLKRFLPVIFGEKMGSSEYSQISRSLSFSLVYWRETLTIPHQVTGYLPWSVCLHVMP